MIQDIDLKKISDLMRALSDPTRLEICRLLAAEELCVCQLVDDLGLAQSLVSHHIKVLKQAGLLDSKRRSYWTYYRLRLNALEEVGTEIESLREAAASTPPSRPPCC